MKGKRAGSAGALILGIAVLFGVLAAGPQRAFGAPGIDIGKTDCRITFTLDEEVLKGAGELGTLAEAAPDYQQYYGELQEYLKGSDGNGNANAIEISLYRIAEVNAGGAYALLDPYKKLQGLGGVESANSSTQAANWLEWAEAAAGRAVGTMQEDGTLAPPAGGALTADGSAEIRLTDGKAQGTSGNLPTGLYLVWVDPVDTDTYRYSFVPYLVSLPNNYYNPDDPNSSDNWVYGDEESRPVYVGLKPERDDRYGDLVIEKKLSTYNQTLEGAAFVFEVKAVKEDTLVYSDVVSLAFGSHGTETAKIEHIPAGAEVTVTEIYGGASYESADGAAKPSKTTVIVADSDSAKVFFENKYDEGLNGGGPGVVNHFTYSKDEDGNENLAWEKRGSSNQGAGTNGTDPVNGNE